MLLSSDKIDHAALNYGEIISKPVKVFDFSSFSQHNKNLQKQVSSLTN
jgi:hypothetical protein